MNATQDTRLLLLASLSIFLLAAFRTNITVYGIDDGRRVVLNSTDVVQ
jgi:hypothetical protein